MFTRNRSAFIEGRFASVGGGGDRSDERGISGAREQVNREFGSRAASSASPAHDFLALRKT